MSRGISVRWYSVSDGLESLVPDTCERSGCKSVIRMSGLDDIPWTNDYILLVSDGRETFEEAIDSFPDCKFIVVGSPQLNYDRRVLRCQDLYDAYFRLRAIVAASQDQYDEYQDEPEVKARKAARLARNVAPCSYCGKPISVLGLALRSHERSCRKQSLKKIARGKIVTVYQVCGKAKGSILLLEIPEPVRLKKLPLGAGTHIISDRKLIRYLNAQLPDHFDYQLEKD